MDLSLAAYNFPDSSLMYRPFCECRRQRKIERGRGKEGGGGGGGGMIEREKRARDG